MLDDDELRALARTTVGHYEADAEGFWEGTRDHDVTQNRAALLDAVAAARSELGAPPPYRILDLGCGPGRDLAAFRDLGHAPTGLDGCASFVAMAKAHSGAPVLHQDMLRLDLPAGAFDGVFANASLFHVPSQELPRVLGELARSLAPRGVLFASNPRDGNREGWYEDRYGSFLELDRWRALLEGAGFDLLRHYYRPTDAPPEAQRWLAVVARVRA